MIWLILLLLLPVFLIVQTADDDCGYLTNLIESSLLGVDCIVTIIGFEGALWFEVWIVQMMIVDAEGVWLMLEDLVL